MATTGVIETRTRVAAALAAREFDPSWDKWVSQHGDVLDADGDYVEVCLGADEPAIEIAHLNYPHPVLLGTVVDGQIAVVEIGSADVTGGESKVPVPDGLSVGDVFRLIIEAHGEPLILTFEDSTASLLVTV